MARSAESLKIQPWAADAPTNRQDPSAVGLVRRQGWGQEYSQIGGPKPERKVWNQLEHEVTTMLDEINRYGILPWDTGIDYQPHAVVQHEGGLWLANVATGPSSVPETPGSGERWRRF